MIKSTLRGNTCGYCSACVRMRLCMARGRVQKPQVQCAYKHILDAYGGVAENAEIKEELKETVKSACVSCRWTSHAQFPETPPSSSDLSLEWSSQFSQRSRIRRRYR